jgi:hypothetical protein
MNQRPPLRFQAIPLLMVIIALAPRAAAATPTAEHDERAGLLVRLGLGVARGGVTSGDEASSPDTHYDLNGDGVAFTLSSGAFIGPNLALTGTLAAFWAPRTKLLAGSADAVVPEPDRNLLTTYLGLGMTGFFAHDISAQGSLGAVLWGTEGLSDLSYRVPGLHGSVAKEWRVSDALAVGLGVDLLFGFFPHSENVGGHLGLLLTATHF